MKFLGTRNFGCAFFFFNHFLGIPRYKLKSKMGVKLALIVKVFSLFYIFSFYHFYQHCMYILLIMTILPIRNPRHREAKQMLLATKTTCCWPRIPGWLHLAAHLFASHVYFNLLLSYRHECYLYLCCYPLWHLKRVISLICPTFWYSDAI